MLHRFRRAMVRPGGERLTGKVEVDESYVGMRDSSKLLTGAKLKSHTARSVVAIAVEMQEPKGFGRITLRRVAVDSERYLLPFVRDAVEPGTRVHTDGSAPYDPRPSMGTFTSAACIWGRTNQRMCRCQGSTGWLRFSSAGFSVLPRGSAAQPTPLLFG
jgi:hypothetical protein